MAVNATEQPALVEGYDVRANDGVVLGTLAALTETHLRVDVANGRDYWLTRSMVAEVQDGAICLTFDSSQVEDFATSSPAVQSESPMLDEQADVFSSDEEQERKRRAMMRGYEEEPGQRAHAVEDGDVFEDEPAYRQPSTGAQQGAPD
jgi:hypothetical protein